MAARASIVVFEEAFTFGSLATHDSDRGVIIASVCMFYNLTKLILRIQGLLYSRSLFVISDY